jgi:DNA-binding beta-propeller fold protein YncE
MLMMRIRIGIGALSALFLLCLLGFGVGADAPDGGYRVLKKIPVGGEGGWDYLTMDAAARRLYVTRSNRVMVVDVDEGKVVGEVANTPGVHGVALVAKHKRGFTSNGKDSTATVFDLETLREIARPKVGSRPDAILYDPSSDRVFTFNAGSKDATALAAADGKAAGTVDLGGRPESGVADEKGMVYVNIMDKNEVAAVDAHKLQVKARWPLDAGKNPTGIAMDRVKRRLFVTCRNEKMVILDADGGKILATLAIGKGTDACAFDPSSGRAFSSNGDGTLTVVEEQPPDHFRVVANVKTQAGAKTMALDAKTHNVLLAAVRYKPAAEGAKGRPQPEPDSFAILVVGK